MNFIKNLILTASMAGLCLTNYAQDISQAEKDKIQREIEIENSKKKDIKLLTENGKEVNVVFLYGGLLKKIAPGDKFIHSYTSSGKPVYAQKWHRSPPELTTEIPVINGYSFGFFVSINGLKDEDSVSLRVVDTIPQPIDLNGDKEQVLTQIYYLTRNNKLFHILNTFNDKTEKELMQYGTWKKEIFNKDKLIYSEEFQLKPPTEEEKNLNQDFENHQAAKKKSEAKKLDELYKAQKEKKD